LQRPSDDQETWNIKLFEHLPGRNFLLKNDLKKSPYDLYDFIRKTTV
jgi:hypothetical protein